MKSSILCLCAFLATASAWTSPSKVSFRPTTSLQSSMSRDDFLKNVAIAVAGTSLLSATPAFADDVTTLPSGVSYVVKKKGDGPKPEIGELVAIRFAAFAGPNKIDDLFDNPEPYYTRVGSGGLLKGVEEVIPMMRVGDRWELTIPVRTRIM